MSDSDKASCNRLLERVKEVGEGRGAQKNVKKKKKKEEKGIFDLK